LEDDDTALWRLATQLKKIKSSSLPVLVADVKIGQFLGGVGDWICFSDQKYFGIGCLLFFYCSMKTLEYKITGPIGLYLIVSKITFSF
jgi:hypothetical protein